MIYSEQDDAPHRGIEAGVEVCGAGAGVGKAGVGYHTGYERR
jgi:hypothetical protein